MNVLAIDTSSRFLSIAVLQEGTLVGQYTTHAERNHSTKLMPAIESLLKDVNLEPKELDEIVVAEGPGSYTGIRIGVTTAKTMSWALDIPLYVVSSLEALSYRAFIAGGYVCPIFDARRGLVFTGLYNHENDQMVNIKPDCNILFTEWLEQISDLIGPNETITFLSPEIEVFKEDIIAKFENRAIILPKIYHHPEASFLYQASRNKKPTDPHAVTPNYLRLSEAEANWLREQEG